MTSFSQLTCGSVSEISNLGMDFVMRRGGTGVTPSHAPQSKTQGLHSIQRSGVAHVFNMELMPRRGAATQPGGEGAGLSSQHCHYNVPDVLKASIDHQRHRGRSTSPQCATSQPQNFIAALASTNVDAQRIGCRIRSPTRARSQEVLPALGGKSPFLKRVGSGRIDASVKHALLDKAPESFGAQKISWQESSYLITQALNNAFQESLAKDSRQVSGLDFTQVRVRCIKEDIEEASTEDEDADPIITPVSSSQGDSLSVAERMSSSETANSSLRHTSVGRFSSDCSGSWGRTTGDSSQTPSVKSFVLNSPRSLISGAEESAKMLPRALSGRVMRRASGTNEIARREAHMRELVRAQQKMALRRVA